MYGLALLLLHLAPYTLHDRVLDNPNDEGGQGALTLRFNMTLHGMVCTPIIGMRRAE
jgi:hypothetical protein